MQDRKEGLIALFMLCGLLFIFSPLFGPQSSYIFPQYLEMPDFKLASTITQLVCFVISCALFPFFEALSDKKRVWAGGVCCALCSAGMLLISAPALGAPAYLLIAGAALHGLGIGVLTVCWGFNFRKMHGNGIGLAISVALLSYGLSATIIKLIALYTPLIAAILLALCPLASGLGCFLTDLKLGKPHEDSRHEPITLRGKRAFILCNLGFGFLFGIILNHMHLTEYRFGSIEFFIVAAFLALVFALHKRAADYARGLRIYTVVIAFILPLSTLVDGVVPEAEYIIISLIWAPQIFFCLLIFIDTEFDVPGIPHPSGSKALVFMGLGILMTQLIPFMRFSTPNLAAVMAASLACIGFLTAIFLPSKRRATTLFGFSSYTLPESEESFIERRCDEIAEQFKLTKRELEVMTLLAQGYQTEEISEQLFISPLTTKTHLHKIYAKTDVHSRSDFEKLLHETESTPPPQLIQVNRIRSLRTPNNRKGHATCMSLPVRYRDFRARFSYSLEKAKAPFRGLEN